MVRLAPGWGIAIVRAPGPVIVTSTARQTPWIDSRFGCALVAWVPRRPTANTTNNNFVTLHLLEERPALNVGPVCGVVFRRSSATRCHRRRGVFWRVSALSSPLMQDDPETPRPGADVPLEGRLDSWKEI